MIFIAQFPLSGADMEGGASEGALPHCMLGRGPMMSTSDPPWAISEWLNQGRLRSLPLRVADWMYLFFAETWTAVIVNARPLPRVIVVFAKMGLPIS